MNKTSAVIIYSVIFFAFFDLFAQLPVMSTFATSVGATPFLAGIVIAIYSLSNTFGNIISGVWTDKTGAYKVLFIGLVLSSVSLILYHIVDSPTLLLVVRVIHGFVAGLIVPAAFTLSANLTAFSQQGKKVALTGSFVGFAAILGPAFSGIMASRTSVPIMFTYVAVYGLLVALSSFLLSKRLQTGVKKIRVQEVEEVALSSERDVLKAYLGAFLLMLSQGALAYLLPLYVQSLGYDSRLSGTLLSTFGIMAVIIFLLPTNRIFDRSEPTKLAALGIVLLGASQILIGLSTSAGLLYLVLGLYGIGFAILFPSINTMLIKATTKSNRGKSYGYFYAFFSIGTVTGSALLGWIDISLHQKFMATGIALIFSGLCFVLLQPVRKQTSFTKHN